MTKLLKPYLILYVLIMIPVGLFFDGKFLSHYFSHGQDITSLIMWISFFIYWYQAPPRLKTIMLCILPLSLIGESIFSLGFGMYTYRLANIPLYVPPGHALIYAAVYYFIREPLVIKSSHLIEKSIFVFSLIYGAVWLVSSNDLYGFLCLLFLIFLYKRYKKSRLFIMTMYLLVAYLEQVGTAYGCWTWPTVVCGIFAWLPSGNPPSAISVFYLGLDKATIKLYLRLRKTAKFRLRKLRALVA